MHQIIRENRYLTLATANKKGEAWASPLAYAYNQKNIFFIYSARASRHCRNLTENPKASAYIFNSTLPSSQADGLQFDATVLEVPPDNLQQIIDFYFRASFPDKNEREKMGSPS